ncbi:MAG: NAD(P)/FAD-dependent oxidoreductase [Actinomycetota bacterium]
MSKGIIKTDIAIIGAGIIGCAIARTLSKYSKKVAVIEKEADVGWGTTKANSGILHAGYAGEAGSLKLKLSHKGNKLFRKNAQELGIQVKNIGSLVNTIDKKNIGQLEELYRQGKENGLIDIAIIEGKGKIREMEPRISKKVCASLYAGDSCIVSPYGAAIALHENAAANGIDFLFENEVKSINFSGNFFINTGKYILESEYIINAAGIYSDEVASMIGDASFGIQPIKGQYYLLDKETFGFVNHINFPVTKGRAKKSKGILLTPTVDKNLLVGPNYVEAEKGDVSTDARSYREIKEKASKYFTGIPFGKVIASFSGLRAVSDTNDFIVSPSPANHKFINVAGIQSPGLTCAFSISEMVVDLLKETGVEFNSNKSFNPLRKAVIEFNQQDMEKSKRLYGRDNNYGNIVCRCEKVSEAEVIEAIRRGARTFDGIKFRTRVGMGRCQGGYCTMRILRILSRELNISMDDITKKGHGSYILEGRVP